MTRKSTRNSSPRVVALFVGILTLLIAVSVLAQVPGAGQPIGKPHAALAQFGPPASAQEELPLIPTKGLGRFSADRSQTKRYGTLSMDSNPFLFVAPAIYDAGGYVGSVAVADLNRDGKADLVVLQDEVINSPNSIGVLLGNGDGTFQSGVSYDSGGNYAAVAVADVNRDGKLDLVVVNGCGDVNCSTEGSVGVLFGNGDGTFQTVVLHQGFGGRQLAVGDFNGDGNPDLAVVNSNSSTPFGVLIGNGDGTFQDPVAYDPGGDYTDGVTIADVNRDGKADIIVANGSGTVGVLLSNGDGTFQPVVTYSSGGRFFPETDSPVVADLNGDGKPDLVVGNWASQTVGVLFGNGDGTFQPVVTFSGLNEFVAVAVADVNGDGVPDVLMAAANSGVGVLLGNGNGTFQPLKLQSAEGAQFLVVADLNGDRKPDLAVAMNFAGVGVMLNNSGAPPTTTALVSSLNPANTGPAITYTANVKAQSGGAVTGFVIFRDNGFLIANVGLGNNQAACTKTYGTHASGQHAITATYSGDLQNAGSISTTLIEYVEGVASKTVVTTSGSPSLVGKLVTFTATVTSANGGIPDGDLVTFYDGTTPLRSITLKGGTAVFSTSSLSAKTHYIKASYAGDRIFKPSNGRVAQVVDKYPTMTTLRSSLNPSFHGQTVTFISRVASAGPIPTGTVAFKDGTLGIGSVTLISGVAKLTKSALAVGTHPITAQYLGDAVSGKSTSLVLNQVVK